MWEIEGHFSEWPKLTTLHPELVLDEYDGPRLFTLRSADGQLLLAYQCGQDRTRDRFLIVPIKPDLIEALEQNRASLRDVLLGRDFWWVVDRFRDGRLTLPVAIDPSNLPDTALPKAGARAGVEGSLLRVKMLGPTLTPGRVPASVVKRALDGATQAVKTLVRHVLSVGPTTGRPPDQLRRYYDLPVTQFAFGSVEVAFGLPETVGQPELEEKETLARVRELMVQGLQWASAPTITNLSMDRSDAAAIVEALAKLAPPHTGAIQSVEVSGLLAGSPNRSVMLTRATTERIGELRPLLMVEPPSQTDQGFVREFDKDRSSFILRKATGETIRQVSVPDTHYEDALLAFVTERFVTIVTDGSTPVADLISITFTNPHPPAQSLP